RGSCFCSWSARGCHIMPSERMRRAHLGHVIRSEDRSRHYVRLHRVRRPGDGTSGEQSRSRPAPNGLLLSALRRRGLPAPAEGRPIHPDAVENNRKLARQRHLRSLHAAPLGHWTCIGKVESSLVKEEYSHAQTAKPFHARGSG